MRELLRSHVVVDGVRVVYESVGDGVPVLLIHPSGGSLRWWHAMTEDLATRFRVVQMDLSGHGESGRRSGYGAQAWSREVRAVLDACDAHGALVVGHSMGGRVAVIAAADHPAMISGVIMMDSIIRSERSISRPPSVPSAKSRRRVYATFEEAAKAFKLSPPQPLPTSTVLEPVVRYALTKVEDGWTWRADPRTRRVISDHETRAAARRLSCHVGYLHGCRGAQVTHEMINDMQSAVPYPIDVVHLPNVHHHMQLEAPETCCMALVEFAQRCGLFGDTSRLTDGRSRSP